MLRLDDDGYIDEIDRAVVKDIITVMALAALFLGGFVTGAAVAYRIAVP